MNSLPHHFKTKTVTAHFVQRNILPPPPSTYPSLKKDWLTAHSNDSMTVLSKPILIMQLYKWMGCQST